MRKTLTAVDTNETTGLKKFSSTIISMVCRNRFNVLYGASKCRQRSHVNHRIGRVDHVEQRINIGPNKDCPDKNKN